MRDQILIIGCGYVGLTLGLTLASKGYEVVYVEKDSSKRELIKGRKAHFFEEGIEDFFSSIYQSSTPKVAATVAEAVDLLAGNLENIVLFITLGTPFSLQLQSCNTLPILDVLKEVANSNLVEPIICLRSTVSVGFTSTISMLFPALRNIAFCPERTIEGNALNELLVLPQIVSSSNALAKNKVSEIFQSLGVECLYASSFEAAEAVKLCTNTYRDFKFAFSNIFSDLCGQYNLSSQEVRFLSNSSYSRSEIPEPGLVGGPCLEKDPHILASSINSISAHIILQCRVFNQTFPVFKMREYLEKSPITRSSRILIIGLAFKSHPPTDDTRGSLSVNIISAILQQGSATLEQIRCYDPLVKILPEFRDLSISNSLNDTSRDEFSHIVICNIPSLTSQHVYEFLSKTSFIPQSIISFVHLDGIIKGSTDLFV